MLSCSTIAAIPCRHGGANKKCTAPQRSSCVSVGKGVMMFCGTSSVTIP
ncbi:MAG: hypothetical protein ACOYNH_05375 [Bacteroidia bacterium]